MKLAYNSHFLCKFATMKAKNILFTLLAFLGLSIGCTAQETVKTLEPKEFITAFNADTTAILLDVRKPAEFAEGHISRAINIDWLNPKAFDDGIKQLDRSHVYYIYCRSGRRSNAAAVKMKAAGYKVVDMRGGILHWQELGLPTEK